MVETASAMRIVGGASELRRPLNVGLMVFNDRPDDFFSGAITYLIPDKPTSKDQKLMITG